MQDMCPICCEPFQEKEMVIKYWAWNENIQSENARWGHLDCVFYLSQTEQRKHAPLIVP